MTDIQQSTWAKAQLLANGQIQDPAARKLILEQILGALLGAESNWSDKLDVGEISKDPSKLAAISGDLLKLAQLGQPSPGTPDLSDDALKDRMHRLYLSSMPFKICMAILAVGTALFGVNIGVLSLDTTAVNKVRSEAEATANQAKADADRAAAAIKAAVNDTRQREAEAIREATSALISEGVKKLDISGIEGRILSAVRDQSDHRFDEMSNKVSAVDNKIGSSQARLADLDKSISQSIAQSKKQVDDLNQRVLDATAQVNDSTEKANEYGQLVDKWESAVTVAEKTTSDQGIARIVWFALRNDALLTIGTLLASGASVVMGWMAP